jgi:hypothetical protein
MIKKRRAAQKLRTTRLVVAVAVVAGVLILAGAWIAIRSGANGGLRDSSTALSVPDHVGQPAPAFTAVNVDGQPYQVKPGDGRAKAIVFYMGFG